MAFNGIVLTGEKNGKKQWSKKIRRANEGKHCE
jgi:hypothetical protein